MSLSLKDPRKFSNVFPESNILISQAHSDLQNRESNQLMVALIEDLLKQGQDQLLSVAYNLSPTLEVASYIWDCLQTAINQAESAAIYAKLFALPIVLVVGSTTQVTLPQQLDQRKLQELMLNKQIFQSNTSCHISGRLFDLDGLVKLKPSSLYHQVRSLTAVEQWDESSISHVSVSNLGESVHLRFLIGVSICEKGKSSPIVEANYNNLGLELMQLLSTSLETANATIFPLPFPFCRLSEAAVIGERYRKEIHITMRLSNQVKKLRQNGKQPQVRLATTDDNIRVEILDAPAGKVVEIIHWPLQRADNFAEVCQILEHLFVDVQLPVCYSE